MVMPIVAYSKIKPLRQSKGLNQAEIAAELGISRPTYVLMEQGVREPTITQLYTLARLLGVEPDELCSNLPSIAAETADYAKFKELVLLCTILGAYEEVVTKTKVAILTYLADFAWYNQNGRPMTGAIYRCGARGPVADSYFRAVDELYEAQSISVEPSGTALIIRTIEKTPSKLLSKDQQALVQAICAKWSPESTESIVDFATRQAPCQAAKSGDPIPYEAVLNEPKDSLF